MQLLPGNTRQPRTAQPTITSYKVKVSSVWRICSSIFTCLSPSSLTTPEFCSTCQSTRRHPPPFLFCRGTLDGIELVLVHLSLLKLVHWKLHHLLPVLAE